MAPTRILVLGVLSFSFQIYYTASVTVVLQATPSTIHPLLTRSLRLRCSLQQQQPPQHNTTTNSSLLDVSATQGNLTHVMSIVISKENGSRGQIEEVASVSTYDGPTAEPPYLGSVHVEGNTDKSLVLGEEGYLEVTWTNPPDTVSGLYSCQAFGLNSHNLPVTLKTFAMISSELSFSDLVTYVATNFDLLSELQTVVGSLNSSKDQRLAQLEHQYEYLSLVYNQRVTELEKVNENLTRQISNLNATCCATNRTANEIGNIQTGKSMCASTFNAVTYAKPFMEKPRVFTSVSHLNLTSPDVRVVNENEAGFTIVCSVSDMTVEVDWLAIERQDF